MQRFIHFYNSNSLYLSIPREKALLVRLVKLHIAMEPVLFYPSL